MGACAETRHYSKGNDHRIDRVCVLRAFLAGGSGLAEASARQEMSRIRDFVAGRIYSMREERRAANCSHAARHMSMMVKGC